MRCITTERSLNLYPLPTSEIPHAQFGPARSQFILVDEAVAAVVGPQSAGGVPDGVAHDSDRRANARPRHLGPDLAAVAPRGARGPEAALHRPPARGRPGGLRPRGQGLAIARDLDVSLLDRRRRRLGRSCIRSCGVPSRDMRTCSRAGAIYSTRPGSERRRHSRAVRAGVASGRSVRVDQAQEQGADRRGAG